MNENDRSIRMQTARIQTATRQCPEQGTAQIIELGGLPVADSVCETAPAPRLLPAYDPRTGRLELGAFLLLGATSIALILLAADNVGRPVRALVDTAPPNETVLAAGLSAGKTNHALTNLTLSPGAGTPVGANLLPRS